MTKPNNEPAFPSNISNDFGTLALGLHSGMTLRDYFAIRIIQGWLSNSNINNQTYIKLSQQAYSVSDAMLKQREVNNA